jgi:hypothetical protein
MPSRRDQDISDYNAVEQSDGSWLHNDGDIFWYNEAGQDHREDGPASIYTSGSVFWYLNGYVYSFDKWLKLTPISDEAKMLLRLQYG